MRREGARRGAFFESQSCGLLSLSLSLFFVPFFLFLLFFFFRGDDGTRVIPRSQNFPMLASVRSASVASVAVAARSRPLSAVAVASTPSSLSTMALFRKGRPPKKTITTIRRVTAKKSTAADKESSAATAKGLVVGGKFPSLGKLETEQEGEFVDLDVSF